MKKIPCGWIIFVFVLVYISALTLPYVAHKKVSSSFQETFAKRNFVSESVGTERVAYLDDNVEALQYRLRMVEEAEEEIILSTFDFNADQAGKDMMAALSGAAKRGVKVRVIVDGFSGFLDLNGSKGKPWFQAFVSQENVNVKIYNPINFLKPWNIQARLHDKYFIIDKKMYLLGGRNTTNLFLGDYSSSKNIDRELFVYEATSAEDSSLLQVLDYFENVWKSPDSQNYTCSRKTEKISACAVELENRYKKLQELYPESYETWNWEKLTMETNRISLLSNPITSDNKEPWMWYALTQLMQQGENVTVYTPYIICGKEMYEDLTELTSNGTNIEIITNAVSSGANPWGCTDYLNQKQKIWNTGAKVHEFMGKHSCHTKALLIDERMTILGSYNMDMRSTYQDTELMLAVDSIELNATIANEVEQDKTYSRTMGEDGTYVYGEHYKEKEMSLGKTIFYGLLRVLTIPIRRFL